MGLMASLSSLQSIPGGGMGLPPAAVGLAFSQMSASPHDFGPPALPVLMVRAAAQAVAENPLDVKAHLALYQARDLLRRNQEDYWIHAPQRGQHPSPLRDRLRQVQQVACLFNAVQLQPENYLLHDGLAELYLKQNLRDLALAHMQLAQKAREVRRATLSGDDMKKFEAFSNMKQQHDETESLERNVKQRLSKWKEMSSKEKPFIKANMAHHGTFDMLLGNQPVKTPLGLGKTALDLLEAVDVEALKDNEKLSYVALHYDLLLSMGRADRVAESLRDERVKKSLPPAAYARFQLLAAGALNDYKSMDEALTAIEKMLRPEVAKSRDAAHDLAKACVPHYFEAGAETSSVGLRYTLATRALPTFMRFRDGFFVYESRNAELCNSLTLHGIILLEAGDTKKARVLFQTALDEGEGALLFADRPIARRYRDLLDRQKR